MSEFKNYRDYLKSEHDKVKLDLEAVSTTQKRDMKWGPDGVLGKLSDVLGLYLSVEPDKRRPKLLNWVSVLG